MTLHLDHRTHQEPGGSPDPGAARRVGAIAALVEAATFVVGIAMFATVLGDYTSGNPTPAESVAFLVDHRAALSLWYLVTLLVFGVALVPLALELHGRSADRAPAMSGTAAVFGVLWAGLILATGMISNVGLGVVTDLADADPAQAASVWSSLDAVTNGLGGGNELVGGIWVLLASLAAFRAGLFSRGLATLGVVSAIAGLTTLVPGLEDVGLVFGLGLIAWFAWVGTTLLRSEPATAAPRR